MQVKNSIKLKVVVVGAGFGGLAAARALGKLNNIDLTIMDRTNHHLFQPLLYQVATAGLAASNIASPIRSLLRDNKNTEVLMAELGKIDPISNSISTLAGRTLFYDFLILATGAMTSYFGQESFQKHSIPMKCLDDAISLRNRILICFEKAELEKDLKKRSSLLTFVIVGGGPTGVELAGAISELISNSFTKDFRSIESGFCRILLLEGGSRLLGHLTENLSNRAYKDLKKMGVEVKLSSKVLSLLEGEVKFEGESILSDTIIWTAGVQATPIAKLLNVETDRSGRIKVLPDLSIPSFPKIFAIGDLAACADLKTGKSLPGLAPVALQQGKFVATVIEETVLKGLSNRNFKYYDKGDLVTIGRTKALAKFGRIEITGWLAWILWLAVHIIYLIGFRNRVLVLIEWIFAYLTFQPGARLILERLPSSPANDEN